VAGAGRVYFCDENGDTVVIEAETPQFKELARNNLDEPLYASPAISPGMIFLRTASNLYAIGEPKSP
jgi:hypothetical protein